MTTSSQPSVRPGVTSTARTGMRNALIWTALLLPLSLIGHTAFGQALPTAEAAPISTGFELPRTAGTLQYSVGVNESLSSGYYTKSGLDSATGVNGNVAFLSPSKIYPFSMVFSGGRSWSTSGQPSTLFLNLGLSQVITTPRWNFVFSDAVSYLPQTPSTGLSGIPGVGDLGVPPLQVGGDSGQGILTGYSTRVSNNASASAQRSLTGKTSLQVSGTYTLLDFVGSSSNGVNITGESGNIGLTHRIDARNSLNGNYSYSEYSYGDSRPSIISQTASIGTSHRFTPKLSANLSAGPQWTSSSNTSQGVETPINLYVNAGLSYAATYANFTLGYSRSTNSGFGVIEGGRSDSVQFTASRTFAKVWNGSVSSAYTRTTTVLALGSASATPETVVAAAQLSRALVRSLSAYASYTLEHQSTPSSTAGVNAFSGSFQTIGFGLTYSPTSIHFGTR